MRFEMYGNPLTPDRAEGTTAEQYGKIEEMFGEIPPHLRLHATHLPEEMDYYFHMMKKTRNYPVIPLVWFALLRLSVAKREDFPYCKALNTQMLDTLGCDETARETFFAGERPAPLNERLKLLYETALKSIYDSHHIDEKDFFRLYQAGFDDKTIYEAIDYATWFSGVGRKLNAYLKKPKP